MLVSQLHVQREQVQFSLLARSLSFSNDGVESFGFSLRDDVVGEIVERLGCSSHLASVLAEDLGNLPQWTATKLSASASAVRSTMDKLEDSARHASLREIEGFGERNWSGVGVERERSDVDRERHRGEGGECEFEEQCCEIEFCENPVQRVSTPHNRTTVKGREDEPSPEAAYRSKMISSFVKSSSIAVEMTPRKLAALKILLVAFRMVNHCRR